MKTPIGNPAGIYANLGWVHHRRSTRTVLVPADTSAFCGNQQDRWRSAGNRLSFQPKAGLAEQAPGPYGPGVLHTPHLLTRRPFKYCT